MRRAWLATLFLLAAAGASGQVGGTTAPAPAPAPMPALGGSTWQIAAYLGGMIALFACGAWLLRNGLPSMQRNRGDRKLNISETRGLGARQFLVVAEYENRKMLLGVCPGRIDYLCTLSAAEPEFPNLTPEKPE
jgi:flagellar protein FliO/FliZ